MTVHQPNPSRAIIVLGRHALTCAFTLFAARAHSAYHAFMRIPERDREIVKLVGRFKQLTTEQIKALIYPDQPHNPHRRAIARLLDNKLLARVNERMAGGMRGGNQMYVYQLGSEGRRLFERGRRGHSIVIDHHALAVADVYVSLFQAHRSGTIRLLNWATEPDCHLELDGTLLKPDLYIDIAYRRPSDGQGFRHQWWLEIDLGSEHKRQILDKLNDYTRAYHARDRYPLGDDNYPSVLFLATRDERASELQYWLRYAKLDRDYPLGVGLISNLLTILQR